MYKSDIIYIICIYNLNIKLKKKKKEKFIQEYERMLSCQVLNRKRRRNEEFRKRKRRKLIRENLATALFPFHYSLGCEKTFLRLLRASF